jgi:hypothetical protein
LNRPGTYVDQRAMWQRADTHIKGGARGGICPEHVLVPRQILVFAPTQLGWAANQISVRVYEAS